MCCTIFCRVNKWRYESFEYVQTLGRTRSTTKEWIFKPFEGRLAMILNGAWPLTSELHFVQSGVQNDEADSWDLLKLEREYSKRQVIEKNSIYGDIEWKVYLKSSIKTVRTLSLSANPRTAASPFGCIVKLNGSSGNPFTNSETLRSSTFSYTTLCDPLAAI